MKTLLICGALLVFTGPALVSGLITVDRHCRSNQTCVIYGALGRPLYLQLPDEGELRLFKIISGNRIFYLKKQEIRENPPDPRWQFNTENRTMIISRAEKEDSGRYRLDTFSSDGKGAGIYYLQLIIEAVVSSVKVTDSCFSIEKRKVHCSSDGDQIQFSWTGIPHDQDLTDGNQTLLLNRSFTGSVSCHVKNHVSSGSAVVKIEDCPALVSSVEVMYSCFFRGNKAVFCFSDGDQIQFSWTLNGIPHDQNLTDGNQTLLLDKDYTGNVTCYVKNQVSSGNRTVAVRECSDTSSVMFTTISPAVNQCTQWDNGLMVFVTVWLFEVIILVSLLVGAFYIYTRIYRKQRSAESKEQEGEEPL